MHLPPQSIGERLWDPEPGLPLTPMTARRVIDSAGAETLDVLVCGPSCSGKSTFVRRMADPEWHVPADDKELPETTRTIGAPTDLSQPVQIEVDHGRGAVTVQLRLSDLQGTEKGGCVPCCGSPSYTLYRADSPLTSLVPTAGLKVSYRTCAPRPKTAVDTMVSLDVVSSQLAQPATSDISRSVHCCPTPPLHDETN
jgi:hypothetical protein